MSSGTLLKLARTGEERKLDFLLRFPLRFLPAVEPDQILWEHMDAPRGRKRLLRVLGPLLVLALLALLWDLGGGLLLRQLRPPDALPESVVGPKRVWLVGTRRRSLEGLLSERPPGPHQREEPGAVGAGAPQEGGGGTTARNGGKCFSLCEVEFYADAECGGERLTPERVVESTHARHAPDGEGADSGKRWAASAAMRSSLSDGRRECGHVFWHGDCDRESARDSASSTTSAAAHASSSSTMAPGGARTITKVSTRRLERRTATGGGSLLIEQEEEIVIRKRRSREVRLAGGGGSGAAAEAADGPGGGASGEKSAGPVAGEAAGQRGVRRTEDAEETGHGAAPPAEERCCEHTSYVFWIHFAGNLACALGSVLLPRFPPGR